MCEVPRERRRLLLENRTHNLCWRVAGEWRMTGHHFVKHHAQAPDIAAVINVAAAGLLRRHVTNSSNYRPQIGPSECHRSRCVRRSLGEGGFGKLCNAEVEHFYVAVRPKHDVLRFDIAMDNSRLMRGSERTRYLYQIGRASCRERVCVSEGRG